MFLKSKICLTIVSLYEILAVILLQSQRVCDAMFGVSFCDAHVFKYFIICFAVPMVVFLIVMWIMEIIDRVRHRHTLFYKATHAMKNIVTNVKDKVSENVSAGDLEKLITAALMVGLKRYADKSPHARKVLDEMNKVDVDYDEYDDDEEDEADDEDYEEEIRSYRRQKNKKAKNNRKRK